MSPAKTATLSSLLVSKTRTGRPEPSGPVDARSPAHANTTSLEKPLRRVAAAVEDIDEGERAYYKALTLKVDKPRFTRLKALGVNRNLPSQALMTEALDLLFSKHRV